MSGGAWPWPNTDAIQEIEVLQLGAPAEYGGLQGAVFNIVTRQGSNQFHGDGNFYYSHQNLTARNTTANQDDGLPFTHVRYRDTTWQLGGPFLRDKFWFFGSYQYQTDWYSQPGTSAETPTKSDAKRVFYKFNFQINQNHSLMHAYHDDYWSFPGTATASDAPSSIANFFGDNPSPNFVYTGVLSDKSLVELRYSGFYARDAGLPLEPGEPKVKTRFRDLDTGDISGGIYSWADNTGGVSGVYGKFSHYADRFMGGSHDMKLGVQYKRGGNDFITGNNDYIYTYSGVPAYGYTQLPFHQGGMMNTLGMYVDDTYRIGNRVALNLGLRFDRSRAWFDELDILNAQGEPTGQKSEGDDDLFTWSSLSPRLGLTFKLNASGRSVLKAHYGRYYQSVITGEFDPATPSIAERFRFDVDSRGQRTNFESVFTNRNFRVDSERKDPFTDQYMLQFEQEVLRDLGLMMNYVYKRGDNYAAWRDPVGRYAAVPYVDSVGREASGQTVTVYQLLTPAGQRIFELTSENLPGDLFSRYNGLTFQVNKRMRHNWQGTFSLVLSKSEGRLGSSLSSPTAAQSSGAGTFGRASGPNDFVNTEGRLIGDRPVVAKTQLVYNFPWGITLAGNFQHQTGRLWSRQIRVGGLGFPARPLISMEANTGDRRVADLNLIDLRIQKAFALQGNANVALFFDVLNLTNSDANEGVLGRDAAAANFGIASRFVFPRRLTLGGKIRF